VYRNLAQNAGLNDQQLMKSLLTRSANNINASRSRYLLISRGTFHPASTALLSRSRFAGQEVPLLSNGQTNQMVTQSDAISGRTANLYC
jgi:hypothetical protein